MTLLDAVDLDDNIFCRVLLEDLGEFSGLLIALNVLETVGLINSAEESVDLVAALSKLGSGSNEALLARKLAERGAADTLDVVLKDRVGDTLDDLVNVVLLLLGADTVLVDDQMSSLLDSVTNDVMELFVLEYLVDVGNLGLVSIVGSSGVRGVDSEELTLNVWLEIVDVVNALDLGLLATILEWLLLDAPLIELLNLDIQAGISILLGNNSVNRRVGETSLAVDVLLSILAELALNESSPCSCGIDSILASNDCDRVVKCTSLDRLGNRLCNKLEDVGADSAGDNVSRGNFLDDLVHLILGVDGPVVVNGELALAIITDLSHSVGGRLLEGIDDAVHNIDEDNLKAGIVEKLGNEATANVA